MWTPSTFSQSAGVRPMATHSSTPSNPLVHDPSCPIKVDPNDLWMMATDTQMSLFFSWKGEEDCCGAAWETVSMRGWMRPLIGLNLKSKKNPKKLYNTQFLSLGSRAPPKSSSPDAVKQQMASQSETGEGPVSGLKGSQVRYVLSADWCLHVAAQDQGTANTAALKSTSTTAASRGLTWTRDALQNCLSSLALETVF